MDPTRDRYTDTHVRGDLNLHRVARDYVTTYVGEFYLILECRARLERGETLTVSQVRAVLNVMRSDPTVSDLPVPTPPRHGNTVSDSSRAYRDTLRHRPAFIDLPTKIHFSYGISLHKRAFTIHKVDHALSCIRYFPHMTQVRFEDRFNNRVRWFCAADVPRSGPSHPGTRLITEHERDVLIANELRRACPQCDRSEQHRAR